MKRAILLVVALLVVGGGLAMFLAKPPARPAATPAHAPAPTPTPKDPNAMTELAVDLAATGEELVELDVRPSQSFMMRLDNRAPSALYRVKVDLSLSPQSPHPPASAMNQDYELGPSSTKPVEAGCEALRRADAELLAARDEAEAREKTKALAGILDDPDCLSYASVFRRRLGESSKTLTPYHRFLGGDSLRMSVERLDPTSRAVVRSWRVQVVAQAPRLAWKQPNESAWIAGEISRQIGEMARRAEGTEGGPAAAAAAGIAPAPEPYVWAPAAYEPLAKRLLAGIKRPTGQAASAPETASTLLNPTSAVMEQENRRISERLAGDMLDARAHGQAALLLATLALREAAGDFSDARPALCGVSAHLAMARALGGGGVDAGLAEAALLAVALRQRDALQHIEALERTAKASAGVSGWLRALRLRTTRDWRSIADPGKASLLERLELYRAARRSGASSLAHDLLFKTEPARVPDWARITLSGSPSVEEGTFATNASLPAEIADLVSLWKVAHGSELTAERLSDALTAKDVAAEYRVVDWALWASFFERHISHSAREGELHLDRMLGLPEDAAKYRDAHLNALRGLDLVPFLDLPSMMGDAPNARSPRQEEACRPVAALIRLHPERVTASNWQRAWAQCLQQRSEESLPAPTIWFSPALPRGTAYDVDVRAMIGELNRTLSADVRGQLPALAPFDVTAHGVKPGVQGPQATPASLRTAFGPLADYDLAVMTMILDASKGHPADFRQRAEAMAALEPYYYFTLGWFLAGRDMDDAAAAAYEKGVAKVPDRVGVSANVGFLIDYYLDRGRQDDALATARMAADTYSAAGLASLGRLNERLEKYDDAEECYQKIATRYKDTDDLDEFYIRYEQRVGDGRHKAQAAAAAARLFPGGLTKATVSDLRGPHDAEEVRLESGKDEVSERFGMRQFDVILIADGYRVRTWKQYLCVRSFTDDPASRIVVWRGRAQGAGTYVELQGPFKRVLYGPRGPGRRI